jgi:hypothetical protein
MAMMVSALWWWLSGVMALLIGRKQIPTRRERGAVLADEPAARFVARLAADHRRRCPSLDDA